MNNKSEGQKLSAFANRMILLLGIMFGLLLVLFLMTGMTPFDLLNEFSRRLGN